jgi:inosine-uridine nucleoside N-ribohydrolase
MERDSSPSSGIPVILDTDIGSDIDDTWALAMMLNSPELDVKLVTTCTYNTTYRARIVAKLLEITGRTDIPIGIGTHESDDEHGQAAWVKDYNLARYPGTVYADGIGALVDTIMSAPEGITLVPIGPLPNLAAALEREPRITDKVRFVGMHGCIYEHHGESGGHVPDYNTEQNIKASQKVFTADWDMTITPLDTCDLVVLTGDKYRAVRESPDPLARAVIENYRIWLNGKPDEQSSTLFDTATVYASFADELLHWERLPIVVSDEGLTEVREGGKMMNCATRWKDLSAFEDLLVERMINGNYART